MEDLLINKRLEQQDFTCKMSGSHSSEHKDDSFLGYNRRPHRPHGGSMPLKRWSTSGVLKLWGAPPWEARKNKKNYLLAIL
jgi:hypothetical protein